MSEYRQELLSTSPPGRCAAYRASRRWAALARQPYKVRASTEGEFDGRRPEEGRPGRVEHAPGQDRGRGQGEGHGREADRQQGPEGGEGRGLGGRPALRRREREVGKAGRAPARGARQEVGDVSDKSREDVERQFDESQSVGQAEGGESTGHRSGRRIVEILRSGAAT